MYDEKRREIRVGDTIEFKREPEQVESVQARVVGLLNYETFADLVNDFPAEVFGHPNSEHLLESIFNFYTKEQEATYTVLGIRINLI